MTVRRLDSTQRSGVFASPGCFLSLADWIDQFSFCWQIDTSVFDPHELFLMARTDVKSASVYRIRVCSTSKSFYLSACWNGLKQFRCT